MANEMDALGELICRMNPYTNRKNDPATGLKKTGGMQIQPPHANTPVTQGGASTSTANAPSVDDIIKKIPVEIVRNYGEKWAFKGQSFSLKTAVRIPYHFEATNEDGEIYMQTETLLIGYAGSDGP